MSFKSDAYRLKLGKNVNHNIDIWMTKEEAVKVANNMLERVRIFPTDQIYFPFSVEDYKEQGENE